MDLNPNIPVFIHMQVGKKEGKDFLNEFFKIQLYYLKEKHPKPKNMERLKI